MVVAHTTTGRYRASQSVFQANGWLTLLKAEKKTGGRWTPTKVGALHFPPNAILQVEEGFSDDH